MHVIANLGSEAQVRLLPAFPPGVCCLLLYKEFTPAAFQVSRDVYQPLPLALQGLVHCHTPLRSIEGECRRWKLNAGMQVRGYSSSG
jgi:hypothetical protein